MSAGVRIELAVSALCLLKTCTSQHKTVVDIHCGKERRVVADILFVKNVKMICFEDCVYGGKFPLTASRSRPSLCSYWKSSSGDTGSAL